MCGPEAEEVAAAFGLEAVRGGLVPLSFRSSRTWRLDTADGSVLVKHVAAEGWLEGFAAAMEFEGAAGRAGVAVPRRLEPVVAAVGVAASVEGLGLVRAYEWVDGRELDDNDDVSEWLGDTLARLHSIAPVGGGGGVPEWYRLGDRELWAGWLAAGERAGKVWAGVLRERLDVIVEAGRWVERGLADAGDFVMTHRDVEPWNVMVAAGGPVLIDWDMAGPDSAGLEAAQAMVEFARRGTAVPDPDLVRRIKQSYVAGGGTVYEGPYVLARRVGLRLGRLAERLRMSLGDQGLGSQAPVAVEQRATEQIAEMPAFFRYLRNYRP
ncbi:hypothetical protein Aab01nite_57280 [Paractinoplanes abujensis]|nr:hypothetical protein Aab01nite_57280 [Actinoplanes abujensis]